MRTRWTIAAVAVLAAVATGCNDDGRTLTPAPPTSEAPPTTATSAGDADAASGLRLTSPDVIEGEPLDPRFTCEGLNVVPELLVSGVPPAAAELAVAVVDLDADGFVHWVVAGLPPTTTRLAAGELPPGAVFGRTDSGVSGWDGPCPPPGDEPHRYEFRLYVAAEPLGLTPGLDGREAIAAIEAAAIDVTRLTAQYGSAGG